MAQGSKYYQANSSARKLGVLPAVAGKGTDGKAKLVLPDGTTIALDSVAAAAITAALGEDGDITKAINGAIEAAIGEDGAVTNAISGAITAALAENGAIAEAISAAITAHTNAYQHTPVA